MNVQKLKNERHRRLKRSSSSSSISSVDHCGEKKITPKKQNNPCELVNKIASIDIWATERLYDKWRRQAIDQKRSPSKKTDRHIVYKRHANKLSCLNHGSTNGSRSVISSSGNYFKASLTQPNNAELLAKTKESNIACSRGGDAVPTQHACQRQYQHKRMMQRQSSHLQQKQYRQHLPNLGDRAQPNRCRYHLKPRLPCQESEAESSETYWRNKSSSSVESFKPNFMQRACSNNGRFPSVAVMEIGTTDSDGKACRVCHGEKRLHQKPQMTRRIGRNRQENSENRLRKHVRYNVNYPEDTPKTIEAVVTIMSPETDPNRQEDNQALSCDHQKHWNNRSCAGSEAACNKIKCQYEFAMRQNKPDTGHSSRLSSNFTKLKPTLPSDQGLADQPRRHSIDQSTYIIIKSISCSPREDPSRVEINCSDCDPADATNGSYNIARVCRTQPCRIERIQQLPKPVVWVMADQSTKDVVFGSQNDTGTMCSNSVIKNRSLATQRQTANHKRTNHKGLRTISQYARSIASRDLAAKPIAWNNSVDRRSLLMLSSITKDGETATQTSESVRPAYFSEVRSSKCLNLARIHFNEVKMQSNATAPNDSVNDVTDDDLDGMILQAPTEFGELKGIEPKTGSVTRRVQAAVLQAANLLKAKGFAGLLSTRPSNAEEFDLKSTDTAGTDTRSLDSDNGEDWVEEESTHDEEKYADESGQGEKNSSKETAKPNSASKKEKVGKNDRALPKQDDHAGADNRLTEQQQNTGKAESKKLLPMTECPTTQHRIECYRTRSGRVKCYMTARHPVKCRVRGGRIVCKATTNPEASYLPYPCNAAWQ